MFLSSLSGVTFTYALFFLSFFAEVLPQALTHFFASFFIWIMTSSLKIVREEKSCGLRLALTKVFSLISLCSSPFLVTLVRLFGRTVEMLKRSLWLDVFFCALSKERHREKLKIKIPLASVSLSFNNCLSTFFSILFLSFYSLCSPSMLVISILFHCWLVLFPSPSLWLSFHLFYHPPLHALSPLLLYLSMVLRGWVGIISFCITLLVCRHWMRLWQGLDSFGSREECWNNYTHARRYAHFLKN